MTLWRALRRIGFTYGRNKRRSTLKEQDYVISARRKYLRKKISNRNDNGTLKRPEVYLDETYLNKNHSNENTWFLNKDGPWVNKPSGRGQRLIIVHAITMEGWVDGAELVFQAKSSTGDYHGQMNYDNFSKWFSNQLLPNIPNDSIIIMDNARYHNILADNTFPTPRSSKRELQAWLEKNHSKLKLHDDSSMLKAELYEICKKIAPPPEFKLDRIAEKHGHRVLRTPQYHCELQPIEFCWGIVKNFCSYHCDFTMKGLNKELHKGFSKVSKTTCKKLIGIVRQKEDLFWKEDAEFDALDKIEQGTNYSTENYINDENDF
jgi:transposase